MTPFVALLALACATADPAADRAAFTALQCPQIRDERLRDECFLFATKEAPEQADAFCEAVKDPILRQECLFVAVDAQEMVGPAAAHACGGVGKFVSACHANAISREVSRLPAMEDAELVAAIDRILRQFRVPRPGEAAEMARRHRATAAPAAPAAAE